MLHASVNCLAPLANATDTLFMYVLECTYMQRERVTLANVQSATLLDFEGVMFVRVLVLKLY